MSVVVERGMCQADQELTNIHFKRNYYLKLGNGNGSPGFELNTVKIHKINAHAGKFRMNSISKLKNFLTAANEVDLLERLVRIYKTAVEEIQKLDSYEAWKYLSNHDLTAGICWVVKWRFKINVSRRYWLVRHIKNGPFWMPPACKDWRDDNKEYPSLAARLRILEAELEVHKRWGCLARYIKPKIK